MTELMEKRFKVKELKNDPSLINQEVTVKGWVRTLRAQKNFSFMEINDGSSLSNIQVILDAETDIPTGSSVRVTGKLVASLGGKQSVEVQAREIEVL